MIQTRCCLLWAKVKLKWTQAKWKTVLWSDKSKFEIIFGRHGHQTKDYLACYQCLVQKPATLMVRGCISSYGIVSLHTAKSSITAEGYIQVLEQHPDYIFFSEVFVYLSTMKINHALQRLQQHDFIGEEIRCWSEDLSPAENIWHTMTGKIWQKRPSTMWPYFSLKCPAAGLLRLWAVVKRRLDATEWWTC